MAEKENSTMGAVPSREADASLSEDLTWSSLSSAKLQDSHFVLTKAGSLSALADEALAKPITAEVRGVCVWGGGDGGRDLPEVGRQKPSCNYACAASRLPRSALHCIPASLHQYLKLCAGGGRAVARWREGQELVALQPLGPDARLAEALAGKSGLASIKAQAGSLSVPVEVRQSPFYTMIRYRARLLRRAYHAIAAVCPADGAGAAGAGHTEAASASLPTVDACLPPAAIAARKDTVASFLKARGANDEDKALLPGLVAVECMLGMAESLNQLPVSLGIAKRLTALLTALPPTVLVEGFPSWTSRTLDSVGSLACTLLAAESPEAFAAGVELWTTLSVRRGDLGDLLGGVAALLGAPAAAPASALPPTLAPALGALVHGAWTPKALSGPNVGLTGGDFTLPKRMSAHFLGTAVCGSLAGDALVVRDGTGLRTVRLTEAADGDLTGAVTATLGDHGLVSDAVGFVAAVAPGVVAVSSPSGPHAPGAAQAQTLLVLLAVDTLLPVEAYKTLQFQLVPSCQPLLRCVQGRCGALACALVRCVPCVCAFVSGSDQRHHHHPTPHPILALCLLCPLLCLK